ncbi:MAG: hypothetical protein ACHRHE_08115 [Tepidisphaerales bacterium]
MLHPIQNRNLGWSFFVLMLLSSTAAAQPVEADDLVLRPEMAPERCAESPPEEIRARLNQNGAAVESEAGIDGFYEIYAEQLRPVVDKRFPQLQPLRQPLTDLLKDVDHLLWSSTGGNWYGHELSRIPGRVEWLLMRIGRGELRDRDRGAGYTRNDIKRLAIVFAKANSQTDPPETLENQRSLLRATMRRLRSVETLVDDETAKSLRGEVAREIARAL